MKKWQNAEIRCVDLSGTEHQWKLSWECDGGYFGDGKISGWFGPDPCPPRPNPTPAPTPRPVPQPEPTPDSSDVINALS